MTLKGEKVTLRAIERDDLKRLHELAQNVDLVILADGSWSPTSLASWEKEFDKRLEDRDPAWFAIVVDDKVIGTTGLHHQRRMSGVSEFGIEILDPDYLGKGYGRDAIRVLLGWAFRVQNWRRIWLETLATNERALRSYRACGFVEEGRLRQQEFYNGDFVDIVVMGLLRTEWEAQQAPSLNAQSNG